MRALGLAAAAWLLIACNDSGDRVTAPPSAPSKACTDGGLDRPGELPRPPQGRFPCELIPPGLDL
jgi:hypothetical protein